MQKRYPFDLINGNRIFKKFCNENQMLMPGTAIFLCDLTGRVLKSKNLQGNVKNTQNLARLLNVEDFKEYICNLNNNGVLLTKLSCGKGEYAVITVAKNRFSKCVVLDICEENSPSLDDYLNKLCSYREFFDGFSNFELVDNTQFCQVVADKIQGIGQLITLKTLSYNHWEKPYVADICIFSQKLINFVEKSNSADGVNFSFFTQGNVGYVSIPRYYTKLVFAVCALMIRKSRFNNIQTVVGKNKKYACLTFQTECQKDSTRCIYEKAILQTLEERGCKYEFSKNDSLLRLSLYFDICEDIKDVEVRERLIYDFEKEFDKEDIESLFYAVAKRID